MSADAVLRPRGPLPPGVYWRRRLILFAVLVLVGSFAFRACTDDTDPARITTGPSPSPTTTRRPSARPSTTAKPSVTPTRAAGLPCRETDLRLTATANAKSYPTSVRPLFTLEVTNAGPVSCTVDFGPTETELRVLSGNDRVWSSDDCGAATGSQIVTLEPDGHRSTTLPWSRKRSAPNQCASRADAAPGTYRVVGRLGSLVRPGDVFTLE